MPSTKVRPSRGFPWIWCLLSLAVWLSSLTLNVITQRYSWSIFFLVPKVRKCW